MAVLYSSTNHGLVYYHPSISRHGATLNSPFRFFRPWGEDIRRVQVRQVDSEAEDTSSRHPQQQQFPTSTRGSFLRSVIVHPNSTSNESRSRRKRPVSPIAEDLEEDSTMRTNFRNTVSGPINAQLQRSRMNSDPSSTAMSREGSGNGYSSSPRMSSTSIVDGVIPPMSLEDEKPIASGAGMSMGIQLAEPVLFLQGFEQNESTPGNTAMLRGRLHLRVQKSSKIKAVTLKFKGTAITKWPEGIPPRKTEFEEKDTLMSHTWPFFNAQFENAERGTNADHVQLFKSDGASSSVTRLDALGRSMDSGSAMNLGGRDARKLALSVNQSRSFGKGENPPGPTIAAKGYRTFLPGDYIYNFELPLDSRLPETIDVELGSVKYELEATVERSGAFRANLVGVKEVTLIRAPAEGSLEQVEPIAISRNWEDQLHYDIVISGKSFPLGTQVPIAFKLTPLAKVQCHRIKVLVTENIEYFCSNKRVHRMEPTRKVQLFEKRADSPPVSNFPGSTMRVTAGGGVAYDARARAARGEDVPTNDPTNLLGNLDGDHNNIGPTEMEFSVQLPSCHTMKDRDRNQRLHFDTTYQNIQVHHWIKIIMRLSRPDANDPAKRRHFEISIDSPFHILSCRATQANISLPAYSSPQSGPSNASLYECGCPGAARRRNSPTSFVPTLTSLNLNTNVPIVSTLPNSQQQQQSQQPNQPSDSIAPLPQLARPPTIHAANHISGRIQNVERPIHLLRAPSFQPPAFEDEEPPPPLITPPPQYDSIASPTHGLADYFARLSEYDDDSSGNEDDSNRRGAGGGGGTGGRGSGRVNVPLTPGGRVNRSMDMTRNWVPVGGV